MHDTEDNKGNSDEGGNYTTAWIKTEDNENSDLLYSIPMQPASVKLEPGLLEAPDMIVDNAETEPSPDVGCNVTQENVITPEVKTEFKPEVED